MFIFENKFQNRKKGKEKDFQIEKDGLRRNDYKMDTMDCEIGENG